MRNYALVITAAISISSTADAAPRRVGEYSWRKADASVCWPPGRPSPLAGSECYLVEVRCAGIEPRTAELKVTNPQKAATGTDIYFSGGDGQGIYEASFGEAGLQEILVKRWGSGRRLVQVRWRPPGWTRGPGGLGALGCYPATIITAVFDKLHGKGTPLAITGNSGGADQVLRPLAHYDLETKVDCAIATSGPPLGFPDVGCMGEKNAEWAAWCPKAKICNWKQLCEYPEAAKRVMIDPSYDKNVTACFAKDESWLPKWKADSLMSADADLDWPKTNVRIILGSKDCGIEAAMGTRISEAIKSKKKLEVVKEGPHELPRDPAGARAVYEALEADCSFNH